MAAFNWQEGCFQPVLASEACAERPQHQDQRLEDAAALMELSSVDMGELEAEVDAELQAALIAQCQYLLRLDDSDPAALASCHREEFTCRHEPLATTNTHLRLPRHPRSSGRRQKRSSMSTPSAAAVAAVADVDAVTVIVLAQSIKRARTTPGGCGTVAKDWQTPRTQVCSNQSVPHGRPASCIRAVARDLVFTPAAAVAGSTEPATAVSGNRPPGRPIRAHAASLREGLSIVVEPFALVKPLETRRCIDEINATLRASTAGVAAHSAFYARTLGAAEPTALPFGGQRRFAAGAGRPYSAVPAQVKNL